MGCGRCRRCGIDVWVVGGVGGAVEVWVVGGVGIVGGVEVLVEVFW